ncbi:MAG: DUF488 domain-containing protein [Rikenellaceae bacterium]
MEFYTIGVYGSNEKDFFNKLIQNGIDTFCDIRQRRGVRGSEYSFVNSTYLQAKLHDLDIKYGHELLLAPTSEIREAQKIADANENVSKRSRETLGAVFTSLYKNNILSTFDLDAFIDRLDEIGADKIALFCVETKPRACHRSLVGDAIKEKYGFNVIDL